MDEPTESELAAFHATVGRLKALPSDHPVRVRAEHVAASFARDGQRSRRKARDRARAADDSDLISHTATGATAREPDTALTADGTPGVYSRPRRCYVCKTSYRQTDAFYHLLCPGCAADNAARRTAGTDLGGRRVLLTGGRVKIGYELALMLLRDGADLTVTTRFPADALRRFAAAPGHDEWAHRLHVVGIDLRDPRQVIGLAGRLLDEGRPLDALVNNAAQTLRRPPHAYAALAAAERSALDGPRTPAGPWLAPGYQVGEALPAIALDTIVPAVDASGLLPDLSAENSWSAVLGGLDAAETLEAYLVNAFAPTLLCDRLLPLLLASPHPRRYIVNVSAVEGRFAVRHKTSRHPHTNMAKAALNMLTRTSGPALAERGVYMCAVDTGWITDENPAPVKARSAERGFRTPLDVVDGAARVYDPIVRGEAGDPVAGVFLKDYREAEW
ncbi:SDR family NAD(P)-dependent oxidoreductase [Glycomyces buryatensis]|uniref:SDR family NAD(P)-dependent oxidoreductase n=1 Tax=Glycomyces buryatensis TaxID=2570927 RepID=A0A4V4HSM4_9ACTN|nr:SDR family NAD(P)-dependent oxidoreductase [Glycomyces buryatensis]THV42166.1 SDR family NAD(P)-dependent oxidoreductase [Glycomyces buryatensis]